MASINEKLNYINETKSLIKDKLNDLGSEIEDETTFREYTEKIKNLYNEWPKINDEDTTITLNDTKKGKMNIQLKGNMNQLTTTGKNKFNGNAVTTTTPANWDIIFENNILTIQHKNTYSTGTPGVNLGILDNGTYTLNGTLSDKISLYKDDVYSTVLANGDTFNTNGTENISIKFGNSKATTKTYSNLMISIGGGDYEPYTGGIASPNPDYPQNVEVVTGENTITISNEDNTQSQSKSLSLGDLEYNRIENYKDEFVKKADNKWYLRKNIGKITLKGTENWGVSATGTPNYIYYVYPGINAITTKAYSNLYGYTPIEVSNTNQGFFVAGTFIRVRYGVEQPVADYKNWLSTHNLIIYYILSTPTEILLNDTLQNQIEDLYNNIFSYTTQTNISQENDNLPFIINATALIKNSD